MTIYKRISGKNNTIPKSNDELLNIIKKQWEDFKIKNNSYPTAQQIDDDKSMVPCRTIERRLGGIRKCRELLGHTVLNYSEGENRSKSAAKSIALSINDENIMQRYLCNKFGNRPNVCRQEPYLEFDDNIRSDFGVYHSTGHFFVDVFTPKDIWSLQGCINHKQKKIMNLGIQDRIYYVVLGGKITQEYIDDYVDKKKNELPRNVFVMTEQMFKKDIHKYKPVV